MFSIITFLFRVILNLFKSKKELINSNSLKHIENSRDDNVDVATSN